MRHLRSLLYLLIAATPVSGQGVPLGNVEIVQDVGGRKVVFPVALALDVQTGEAGVTLAVQADMNLSGLQQNFEGIVKSFPMPRDNCESYSAGNIVAGVDKASLTANGSDAEVKAKIGVAVWDCREGLPSVTVKWKRPCRWCPKVPQFTTHRGSDIKSRLWTDDVDASFSLALETDGTSLELVPTNVRVVPRSDPGSIASRFADFFGVGLSSLARKEIATFVDAGKLRQTLPPQFAAYNPKITTATLYTGTDGALNVRVGFSAVLTGQQIGDLLREALAHKPPKSGE